MRGHPAVGVEWGCPECGSTDIADTHGSAQARYQRPRYGCYGCGVRFDSPKEIEGAEA